MTVSRNYAHLTLPGTYVLILIDVVSRWHISPELLLWGSGITYEKLKDIHYFVEYPTYAKLLERAVELTQEPGLGFYFGMQLKLSTHGIMGFTVSVANNVREGIFILIQFAQLQGTAVKFRLVEDDDNSWLYIEENLVNFKNKLDSLAYEIGIIYILIGLVNIIRTLTNSDFRPAVELRCVQPKYFSRFSNILDSMFEAISFSASITTLKFPKSFLDVRLVTADPLTVNLFKEQCQKELDQLVSHQNIAYVVSKLIFDNQNGMRSIEEVANKLNMSVRTLQRILKENGFQYQCIFSEVRIQKAKTLLQLKDLTLTDIAEKLGYSDVTSFNRAFKKSAGISPGKYRKIKPEI